MDGEEAGEESKEPGPRGGDDGEKPGAQSSAAFVPPPHDPRHPLSPPVPSATPGLRSESTPWVAQE